VPAGPGGAASTVSPRTWPVPRAPRPQPAAITIRSPRRGGDCQPRLAPVRTTNQKGISAMNAHTSPTRPASRADVSFTVPLSALDRALDSVQLALPEAPPVVPAAGGVLIEASDATVTFSATTILRTVSVCLPAAAQTPGQV